jgi:endoglucanase
VRFDHRSRQAEAARDQAERDRQAARLQYGKRTADSPEIQAVYAAAPDILALQIHTGTLTPCRLTDYTPLPGDKRNDNGGKDRPHLIRDGKDLGMLVGPPGRETGLVSFEGFSGDPLLLLEADDPTNYRITSPDDPAFKAATTPIKVMRKSKPDDWQQPIQANMTVRHSLYLKLPHPLTPGKTYKISLGLVNTRQAEATLVFDTAKVWSESIHVNQIGFRPDDPSKRASLSLWMGSGGDCVFPAKRPFHLVDAKTGKRVYTGSAGEVWPADRQEKLQTTRNFNGTAVVTLDFSDFKTPGQYRLEVEGIGCSYPFEISPQVWERAFWVQMKGFYNERSGIALGPPYTDFVRPVCWKPGVNGCMPITQSTFSIVDGNPDGKGNLASGDTGKPVPEAWGGYHDAGDWNPRRIDHMLTTTFWQLELLQLFPDYFARLKLRIPDDAPGPDLLKECLFELDLFRRLQMPDGGVRFGIETDGDPSGGEVSWKQHMPGYVYAPDIYSSYIYASVASRAAQILQTYDGKLAATYRETAVKAMAWAEADRARRKAAGAWDKLPNRNEEVHRCRNLAAVCLYALTRDPRWNAIFLEDTPFKADRPPAFYGDLIGRTAAFQYARLPDGLGDPDVKRHARQALIADADGSLAYQQNNAFGIASDDAGKPQFLGFYSTPHGAVSLVRAYQLTGEAKYLEGAVEACLFPGGANPSNLVYTSGVGANSVKAMNMDAIATGQKPPIGLTPYGNIDLSRWHDTWITWPITYFVGKTTQPDAYSWPTTEAYWDLRFWPAFNEFTIDQTMGVNAYVWGYLAARR